MKDEVKKIFDDLDDYKRFCLVFGHPFSNGDLYNFDNKTYVEYHGFKGGKRVSNNWIRDAKISGRNIFVN
jgi:hypothetical protein